MICELFYLYIVIEDHHKWSHMLSVFPLSLKLSMGVSSVLVLKKLSGTSCTRQGQHNIRCLLYVGSLPHIFCNSKCKCNILL